MIRTIKAILAIIPFYLGLFFIWLAISLSDAVAETIVEQVEKYGVDWDRV